MAVLNRFQDALQYLWEGISRIFRPNDDAYPNTGAQPFDGDPYDEREHNREFL